MKTFGLLTAMSASFIGDGVQIVAGTSKKRKLHWKETQSEEDKQKALAKAKAKRDRKQQRKNL